MPRRQFGALRARLEPDKVGLAVAAQSDLGIGQNADVAPIDYSAKPFIGPNATYYDDHWRWMDWQGRYRSWNWAAATTFGFWLGYRRMYGYAALAVAWLGLLVALTLWGIPLREVAGIHILMSLGLGLYANTLYLQHFRRAARRVGRLHRAHEERVAALERAGGVDRRAVYVMGAALAALIAGLMIGAPLAGLDGEVRF